MMARNYDVAQQFQHELNGMDDPRETLNKLEIVTVLPGQRRPLRASLRERDHLFITEDEDYFLWKRTEVCWIPVGCQVNT